MWQVFKPAHSWNPCLAERFTWLIRRLDDGYQSQNEEHEETGWSCSRITRKKFSREETANMWVSKESPSPALLVDWIVACLICLTFEVISPPVTTLLLSNPIPDLSCRLHWTADSVMFFSCCSFPDLLVVWGKRDQTQTVLKWRASSHSSEKEGRENAV